MAQESSGSTQTSIVTHATNATRENRKQLVTKFQLCHFLTVKNKSFQFYQDMVRFEKDVHKVGLGTVYLNRQSGTEMISYLSKAIVMENITELLNKGEQKYYSLLFDGSSSAKAINEKEVYVIKTCDSGEPRFDVLALEQPDDAGAAGLKVAPDKAISKGSFSFDCRSTEIGLGSDGTNRSKALYCFEKDEIGGHFILILCLCYKLELAIHAAFEKNSKLNEDAEELFVQVCQFQVAIV